MSAEDSQESKKPHACTFAGCTKSFTRAEHLRRHALNHEASDSCCERCGVHFTRPDLLARHMTRHVKRDEEAGGPGLGVLETRKRARRGPDGRIIERPSKRMLRAGIATVKKITSSTGDSPRSQSQQGPQAPVSPPQSFRSSDSYNSTGIDNTGHTLTPIDAEERSQNYGTSFDSANDLTHTELNWPSDGGVGMGNELFEEVFNPDTASSFNQPFTDRKSVV